MFLAQFKTEATVGTGNHSLWTLHSGQRPTSQFMKTYHYNLQRTNSTFDFRFSPVSPKNLTNISRKTWWSKYKTPVNSLSRPAPHWTPLHYSCHSTYLAVRHRLREHLAICSYTRHQLLNVNSYRTMLLVTCTVSATVIRKNSYTNNLSTALVFVTTSLGTGSRQSILLSEH